MKLGTKGRCVWPKLRTTDVMANGSRWLGQSPATLQELLVVLQEHRLDDFWVKNGAEDSSVRPGGLVHFWGNFRDVSHVFGVSTNDPHAIAQLRRRIRENRFVAPCLDGARCRCFESHFGRFDGREESEP